MKEILYTKKAKGFVKNKLKEWTLFSLRIIFRHTFKTCDPTISLYLALTIILHKKFINKL